MRLGIRRGLRRVIERSRNFGEREPSYLRLVKDVLSYYLMRKLVGYLRRSNGSVLVDMPSVEVAREVAVMLLIVVGLESCGSSPLEDTGQAERMSIRLVQQLAYLVGSLLLEDVVELLPVVWICLSFGL